MTNDHRNIRSSDNENFEQVGRLRYSRVNISISSSSMCCKGGAVGINMNVNEVLSQLSGVDLDRVKASQSTADVCARAIRIALFELPTETCSQKRVELMAQTPVASESDLMIT